MAKSENQKLKLLYLRDYLLENTDEDNSVKTADIINHLQKIHDISAERKSIYSDLGTLIDYGVDIDEEERKNGNYKILSRDFQLYELQLLIDSIQSSKFIPSETAQQITDKVKRFASRNDRKKLDRRNYVANRIRSMNKSVFNYVDDIHICIAENKKLTFKYINYELRGKKTYMKKGEFYIVSPYALLWNDNNYYLLAYENGTMKHFRVDKMEKIAVVNEERNGQDEYKALNIDKRSTKLFSMFAGKEEHVELRFSNHITGVIVDRFGGDIFVLKDKDSENHSTVGVNVEVSQQFFGWLCGLGKAVKLLSPDSVVKKMAEYVVGISKMYETGEKE